MYLPLTIVEGHPQDLWRTASDLRGQVVSVAPQVIVITLPSTTLESQVQDLMRTATELGCRVVNATPPTEPSPQVVSPSQSWVDEDKKPAAAAPVERMDEGKKPAALPVDPTSASTARDASTDGPASLITPMDVEMEEMLRGTFGRPEVQAPKACSPHYRGAASTTPTNEVRHYSAPSISSQNTAELLQELLFSEPVGRIDDPAPGNSVEHSPVVGAVPPASTSQSQSWMDEDKKPKAVDPASDLDVDDDFIAFFQ